MELIKCPYYIDHKRKIPTTQFTESPFIPVWIQQVMPLCPSQGISNVYSVVAFPKPYVSRCKEHKRTGKLVF